MAGWARGTERARRAGALQNTPTLSLLEQARVSAGAAVARPTLVTSVSQRPARTVEGSRLRPPQGVATRAVRSLSIR